MVIIRAKIWGKQIQVNTHLWVYLNYRNIKLKEAYKIESYRIHV